MNLTGHHSTRFFRIPLISLTCALLPMALFADLAAATPIISVTPDSLHQALMSGDTASQTLTISNTGATALDYQIDFQRIRGAGAAGGPSIPGRFSLSRELSSAGRFPIRAEDWTSYRESYGAFLSSESSTRVEAAPVSPEGWSGPAAASRVMRQIADSFVIFSDDMESGAGGWTHSSTHVNGIDQWTLQSNVASSGAWSWQVSQHSGVGADALKSPAIDLTGFADATLTFKHYYNFDDCSGDPTFEPDGGIVEVSTDGGGSWTQVFPVGGYPYTLDDICGNILAFFDAYSHDGGTRFAFEPAAFDLTPFAGQIIQIRFHAGWDCGNCGINDGWFIDDVTVKSADFVSWLSADIPSGTVPAGGSVDVSILFDAGGLLEADYPADILITSNDPAAPVVTVPTFLAVTGIPAMTLSASSFSFAPLFVGDSSIASLTVGNTGTAALNVSSIVSDNSSFLSDISAFSVAPGDTQIVLVTFKPTAAGSHSGALTITSDDPTSPVFPLTVSGIGLDPPIMSVAPDSLDEALLTGGATARTVTITNSGGSDLSWESMALKVSGGPTNAYTLTIPAVTSNSMESGDPGSSLPPANVRSTAISATLSDLSGVVIMSNNSVSSWSTIVSDLTLRGAVVLVNSDTLTPALLDSVDIFWTHDFPGWSPAELTALSNWVNAGGSLLFEGDESWSAYNQLLAAIGVNIAFASGGSTGITTNIFPHETTTGVARLNLVSNLGHLSNVSAPAGLLVSDISNQEHCAYSSAGVGRVVAVANEDFINAAIGSEDNQLFANQVFDWLASAVDWLTVTPDSGTVAPAASGALTATFDASGLIGGDYLAEIIITSNDPLAREISIPTHLNVTGAPDITVSDSALAFDSIFIGYNQVLSITITNSGTDVLTVGSVTIDNADFSVDASSFSLNPGQSQVATLTFAPSSAGNISGIMTINSDDPNQPALPIPLSGIGLVAPVIGVSPASLSDSLLTGEAALHTLTISNTGGSDLAFAVSVKNGTSPGSPSAPGARRDSPSVRFVSAAMRAELAESLEKLRREPTLNETSPTTLARQTMDVFYTGDHLGFGVSDYGEIMPFSHPAGISEHLAAGVWVSGYNLSYTISGSNRLAYSAYNARLSIIPVSLTQLVNDSSVAKVEVVTSTADGALIITRTFTFDKSDKYISITNSIENQSGSPITDLVFKSFADWDMRSSPSNDNWDYDLSRNMIYASDGVYAAIASARVPDLMDIAGWNDYRVRPTTVELPVGPVNSFDGLEVLHFELGSLATGAATDVKTVFAAGQDLADLQGAVDRGLVFADWVSVES
ncbi:MAG: choice-of-anchor D domain-containing protein, partial [Candidatus Zixiibacteriota bacterium]